MSFDGLPLVIAWELTLACNLRCRHCGSSAVDLPRVHELTLAESLNICDQFPDLLVQEVDFTGGEPLLREDWAKIAAHLDKLGIRTQILTNCLALNQDKVTQIRDAGITAVGVSLDGLEPTHDYIRVRKGLFRHALAMIDCVQRAGLPVTVITTANALNLPELPSLLEVLRSAGVKRWQIQPVFPLGRVSETRELQLTDQTYLQLGAFAQHWVPLAKQAGLEIELADSFGYFTELDPRDLPWKGCPAGMVALGITSDGKIKGCLSLPDNLIEGDLRQEELWDLWFRPDVFAYTRQYSPKDLGPNCSFCDQAEICLGGCSAMSYGSTGLFHNNPYCFYGIRHRQSGCRPGLGGDSMAADLTLS
jgi:radical SAM protein with 4Fe4S-binding SPASM domain